MAAKLTKEELLNKAQERFNAWVKMYVDTNVTAEQMYEDMTCSVFTGDANYDKITNDDPEKWLQEHDEHWNESTCYYMYGEDTEVKEYE